MQVYSVIAGIDYEGEIFRTLRLFNCKSAAEAYKADLEAEYDYALMETKVVEMQSAILAA